ncbi:MAG TPA: preprotein translocase subunit SecG [candidate division Zixibacteria bacterium]|nr:preprotein translocase subunit SecG [candidate division Zixibacteria bacterium]
MVVVVTIIHVIVSIGLILVVLLQTGKGAEVGAVFGGGSSATIFGSSGAGNFLTKLTTGMAIVFMITSLTLGYFAGRRPSSTIFDSRTPAVEPRATPPAAPSPQQGQQAPAGEAAPVPPSQTEAPKQ